MPTPTILFDTWFPTSKWESRTVSFSRFGAVGDGSTDNSAAWVAFGNYARAETAAGRGVTLYVATGTYNYDGGIAWSALFGISKLVIEAYGVTFQNTYDINIQPNNSGFSAPFLPPAAPDLFSGAGPLINNTAIGDSTITCKTPAQAGNFSVGQWVLISSLDVQYYGYPPNCDQFDFVQITNVNAGTGVITFSPTLNYAHRDDFPDGGNPNPGGKARVWSLDGGAFSALSRWNIDHTYKGFTCNLAPHATTTYVSLSGRSIKLVDCTWPGVSPSVCYDFSMQGGALTNVSEPDKIVGSCAFDGVDASTDGLVFQSSSIDRVICRNGRGQLQLGSKNSLVQNWDAASLVIGTTNSFGGTRQVKVESSIIRSMPFFAEFGVADPSITVDGVNVSYANGKFTVVKLQSPEYDWKVVPGMWVSFNGPGGRFAGNLGAGIIVRLLEDATNIYIWTTIPDAATPSWSNGTVRVHRHTNSTFQDCSGCETASRLTKAGSFGKNWWNYFSGVWAARTNPVVFGDFLFAAAGSNESPCGSITRINCKVLQPTAAATGKFEMTFGTAYLSATMGSGVPFVVDIDVTIAGEREFTQDGLIGQVGLDAVLLNSISQTALPTDRWTSNSPPWHWDWIGFDPRSYTPYQLPVLELTIETDTGLCKTEVSPQMLNGGVT